MATTSRKKPPAVPPAKDRRRRRGLSPSDTMWYWATSGFHLTKRVIILSSETTDVDGNESGVDSAMVKSFEIGMLALETAEEDTSHRPDCPSIR